MDAIETPTEGPTASSKSPRRRTSASSSPKKRKEGGIFLQFETLSKSYVKNMEETQHSQQSVRRQDLGIVLLFLCLFPLLLKLLL
jgi:hypothetical protein